MNRFFLLTSFLIALVGASQAQNLKAKVDKMAEAIEPQVIEWRRHFHEHPELSNMEFKTAEKVAAHLKSLGMEVTTGVAKTGVVGVLKGGKPGPVVALRADMDALPVKERVDLPFASKAMSTYKGEEVPVMHACGHDTHIAILMGVAQVLTDMKKDLKGTVKFIFQPAEEGSPDGSVAGAELMVKEGVMENPKVDVVFGLHVNSKLKANTIGYRAGGTMASADYLEITVKGAQTHGGYPWGGVDPIVTASQIVLGLQTIVSRNLELLKAPAVVSIGKIVGGVRNNIIPEEVKMIGTIRSLDPEMREQIHKRVNEIAINIGKSAGAEVEVYIDKGYPVTYNDPELTAQVVSTLYETAGKENVFMRNPVTGAEDFAYYAMEAPGFFFFLGGRSPEVSFEEAPPHHTPDFYIDESGLMLGVRSLCNLTLDYMEQSAAAGK